MSNRLHIKSILPKEAVRIAFEMEKNRSGITLQMQAKMQQLTEQLDALGWDVMMLTMHLVNPKQFKMDELMVQVVRRLKAKQEASRVDADALP